MNKYAIYFTYEGTVLQLPQNPETLPVDLSGENQEYNVLGIGPITIPRTPKQKKIQISSYFPARHATPPETFIKFFQDAMYEQRILTYTPVRYFEDGEAFNGGDDGFKCLVNNFSTEERGAETGDFYYTLEIVEYRDYSPQTVDIRPVQTGYALSTNSTRVSEGIQVGDTVQVSGNVYNYPTEEKPSETVSDLTGTVRKKDNVNGKTMFEVERIEPPSAKDRRVGKQVVCVPDVKAPVNRTEEADKKALESLTEVKKITLNPITGYADITSYNSFVGGAKGYNILGQLIGS